MEFSKEQDILQKVVSEAWSNPTFKQELIDSPQDAVERLTGQTFSLPEGKRLEVYDQSESGVLYLNIPEEPNLDDVELTDAQLETVAGGGIPRSIVIACFPPKNIWPPFNRGLPT